MAMRYRCKDHPKYKGPILPNNSCPGCWYMTFTLGPKTEVAKLYAFNIYIEANFSDMKGSKWFAAKEATLSCAGKRKSARR